MARGVASTVWEAALTLVTHSPLKVGLLDRDGRLAAVSERFVSVTGLPREHLIGFRLTEVFGPAASGISRIFSDPRDVSAASCRIEVGSGEFILAEPVLWPLGDDPEQAVALVYVDRGATADQLALLELRRLEALLEAMVENIPSMLTVQDLATGKYLRVNRAVEEFVGRPREQILNGVGRYFTGIDPEQRYLAGSDSDDHDQRMNEVEDTVLDAEARARVLRTRGRLIEDGQGGRYLLTVSEDVTEKKQAEDKLRFIAGEAEAANRAKSAFLANMSHEIRTPLNGVMGIASALARTALRPDQIEMVSLIEMSAKTLEALLSDILDLARIEAGRMELKAEPFDLATSVNACGALFSAAAEAKGLKYQVEVEPGAVGSYIGDAPRLRQIISNLLGNAVKFTQSGSINLQVSALRGETASVLRFDVRDSGIGFDAETKARLFGRFEQADGSITRRFGGTGLGLAISRSLAEAMGGTLDAESEFGHGATFSLTLELTRGIGETELWSSDGEIEEDEGPDLSNFRVLVAEDHPTNRRVVELILGSLDLQLTCVEDGAQAVAAAERERFDLILMDMQMPVMDGLAAIREIRALEARTGRTPSPMFALTANAMQEHVAASAAAGANGHLTKPITADTLIATVVAVANGEIECEPTGVSTSAA